MLVILKMSSEGEEMIELGSKFTLMKICSLLMEEP
jgi:hypothetical protein